MSCGLVHATVTNGIPNLSASRFADTEIVLGERIRWVEERAPRRDIRERVMRQSKRRIHGQRISAPVTLGRCAVGLVPALMT